MTLLLMLLLLILLVEEAADLVGPPLSFDSMSGFVTRYDVISYGNNNDMSIF